MKVGENDFGKFRNKIHEVVKFSVPMHARCDSNEDVAREKDETSFILQFEKKIYIIHVLYFIINCPNALSFF